MAIQDGLNNLLTALSDTTGQTIHDAVKAQRDRDNKLIDIKAKSLMDAIHSGRLSAEEIAQAQAEVDKLYKPHKEAGGILARGHDITRQLFGLKPKPGQAAPEGPETGGLPQSGTPAIPPPPANMSESAPAMAQGIAGVTRPADLLVPPPAPSARPNEQQNIAGIIQRGIGPSPEASLQIKSDIDRERAIAEEKAKHESRMEEFGLKGDIAKDVKNIGAKSAERVAEIRKQAILGQITPRSTLTQSILDARESGAEYIDEDGNPIDLYSLPNHMNLVPFTNRAGEVQFWKEVSPVQKEMTVGGMKYAVNPRAMGSLTQGNQGAGTALGVANPGKTTTRQVQNVNPEDGTTVLQNLSTTTVPNATGAIGAGAGVPPIVPPTAAPAQGGAGKPSPSPAASTTAATATATTPAASGMARRIPSMPFNQWNAAVTRYTPVRLAANQLFGEPNDPNFKGLKDFASIADDRAASKRVGDAIKLTFDGLKVNEKAHGDIVNLLRFYSGSPQALVSAQVSAMQDALKGLNDEERQAYDAVMATYGTIIGLRSLTKASAAKFSAEKLEQEIPTFINTADSKQFYDKLGKLAKEIEGGTKMIPPSIMSQEDKQFIRDKADEMNRLAQGGTSKKPLTPPPAGGGGGKSPSIDDEILNHVNRLKKKPGA